MLTKKIKETILTLARAIRILISYLPYLHPHRWKMSFMLGLGVLDSVIMALIPLVVKFVVDDILLKKNWSLFLIFVVIYASSFILMQILTVLRSYFSLYVTSLVNWRLKVVYFRHLSLLPFSLSQKKQVGEHLYGINNDIGGVGGMVLSVFPNFLNNVALLITAIVAMSKIKWQIFVIYLAAVPFLFILRLITSTLLKPLQEQMREISGHLSGVLCEKIRILPLVKLFARERYETHHYSILMKAVIKQDFKLWRLQTILDQTRWVFESGLSTIMTCYIWFLVIRGSMKLGSAIALSMYFGMILPPFLNFASIFQGLIAGLVPAERVTEFFEQPKEHRYDLSQQNREKKGLEITFEDVGFSYDKKMPVLNNVNFSIPAGHIVALVGSSGSGKTTILNLICSLYLPDRGKIMLGNSAILSTNFQYIRQMVSVAPQETILFTGTIKDNILYGNLEASDEEILKVTELACAQEFIESLPNKFGTNLQSENVALSAGQKHRLTLARSFIKNSGVLLLDEPFANVDLETELRLWHNLLSFKGERTIIVVTHRPPPSNMVDQIYYVKQGNISSTYFSSASQGL